MLIYKESHDLLVFRPKGILNAASFTPYHDLAKTHRDKGCRKRFIHMDTAEDIQIGPEELLEISKQAARSRRHDGQIFRTALLATKPLAIGISNMSITLLATEDYQGKTCLTLREAAEFLDVPVEVLV